MYEHLSVMGEHLSVMGEHLSVMGEHLSVMGEHLSFVMGEHLSVMGEHLSVMGEHLSTSWNSPRVRAPLLFVVFSNIYLNLCLCNSSCHPNMCLFSNDY
jgi:hypothetical protein